ncbi:hypothetical protein Syun_001667 [Stephania yunnanensis]|uniref:Reverse transcriptase zinc-binding domain-containing protein n=1 Tax=Stephania yunnanensis TaxID=152371 RepID=A0AAP0LE46_9MAGN
MTKEPLCLMCTTDTETLIHMLFYCPHASCFWKASPLELNPSLIRGDNFQDLWQSILNILEAGAVEDELWSWLAIGLWQLWKIRNKKVFRDEETTIETTVEIFSERCLEWSKVMSIVRPLHGHLPAAGTLCSLSSAAIPDLPPAAT